MELSSVVKGDRSKHLPVFSDRMNGCRIDLEGCASLQLLDDRES